jgi:hypothetical protein
MKGMKGHEGDGPEGPAFRRARLRVIREQTKARSWIAQDVFSFVP